MSGRSLRAAFSVVFWAACIGAAGCSPPAATVDNETSSSVAPPTASASASALVQTPPTPEPKPPLAELDVDIDHYDFSKNPDLAVRVAENPHAYFQLINTTFARAVCKRFESRLASLPAVRLHGDPHVEQYAVTDLGRGLADFDDASVGPAVIDLVRFATSVMIAARNKSLSAEDATMLVGELFRGYRDGLKGVHLPKKPPAFASALLAKFDKNRKSFLEDAEKAMQPTEASDDSFVRNEVGSYAKLVAPNEPKRPAGFYSIKKLGALKLGIGSGLVRKYLVRLEGSSKADEDDVLMEVKEVSDLSSVPCIKQIVGGAASGRAAEQKRAGDKKLLVPALLGSTEDTRRYWVNEWLANYKEAKIKKLERVDLADLAYEAGIWLAEEHTRQYPGPAGPTAPPSSDKLAISDDLEKEIRTTASALAEATIKGWDRFRRDSGAKAAK